jgi:TolB-like protein/class 3 adenylate cyclase/Flp pilus assembly protein TadD
MTQEGTKRKLAAILNADVKEYSRLMSQDERGTIRTLTAYKEAMSSLIQEYKGRVVDAPGDNLLADFGSVVDAVNCAVEIQREFAERNSELPYNRRMEFRIGVNVGDVVEEEGRIYGDGVNIAARVEGLAEAGGICISGKVYDHVENKLGFEYEYLGEHEVKNIEKPIRVYRVLSYPGAAAHRVARVKNAIRKKLKITSFAAVGVLLIGLAVVFIWQFFMRPTQPPIETASVENMAFPLPDKPSIAVLPFDNLSDDPKQEYFSDGITDDLITDLSKVAGLFVVARNSSFLYKGQPVKIKKIAEELGIRYVLEGSVRRAEDKIRINAQLIDATTGGHLWAERYDRDYKDIFALQDEVIQRIVFALSVKLTQKEKEQLARKYTDNLEAYDYYLRGEQSLKSFTVEGVAKARSMFEKAIELDPRFAQAYAAHGMASYYMWEFSLTESGYKFENDRTQAFQFATKALALDSSLPMAHSVLAGIHLTHNRFDEANKSAAKAVDLEPNNADTYVTKAHVLIHNGRHEKAQKEINTAFRLNPNPPPYYYFRLSEVQFNLRQYSEAVKSIKKTGNAFPDWLQSWFLAPSYAYLGRLDEARAELKKIVKIHFRFQLYMVVAFSNRKLEEDDKHWHEGFRKAGLQDIPPHDRRGMDDIVENMLSGKEIKDMAVGRTWSGFNPEGAGQWWIQFTEDSKLPTRGAWGTETGSYWIEEFRICWKWQEVMGLQDGCGFVYPNPKGTAEKKNQYEWVNNAFAYPFSVEE